jgi:hypothetical protein
VKEESIPEEPGSALQLHLLASGTPAYQEALARYEEIRPVLKQERTLAQHSHKTDIHYWRLWRDLRRLVVLYKKCCRSREVVMPNEIPYRTDMVGQPLGER